MKTAERSHESRLTEEQYWYRCEKNSALRSYDTLQPAEKWCREK